MVVEVSEFINVRERATVLGCKIPTEVALLPWNFTEAESADELLDASEASTVQKILREANIPAARIEKYGSRFRTYNPKSAEWIGPAIFIGANLLSQSPDVPKIILDTLLDYLNGYFRGIVGNKRAKIRFVIEKKSVNVKADYDGPLEGASELYDTLEELSQD
jgi:hypothetical protein